MTDSEPDFQDDVDGMKESVTSALNELTDVKAYTLAPGELEDFKAAQYALRNLAPEHGQHDVESVYDD